MADWYLILENESYKKFCKILNEVREDKYNKNIQAIKDDVIEETKWIKATGEEDEKYVLFNDEKFDKSMRAYLTIIADYDDSKKYVGLKNLLDSEIKVNDCDDKTRADYINKLYKNYNEQKRNLQLQNGIDRIRKVYREIIGNEVEGKTLFDFIIEKGLLTTPKKNNPYGNQNRVKIKDVKKFLNHFSLHLIKIDDQKYKYGISYIVERLTNANLINHIYNSCENTRIKQQENEAIKKYPYSKVVSILGAYPLVDYRLHILDKIMGPDIKYDLSSREKKIMSNIIEIISHQIFVYFPIVNMFYLLLRSCMDKDIGHQEMDDCCFEKLFREDMDKKSYNLIPKYELPKDKNNKIELYKDIANGVYSVCFETMTFPEDKNLVDEIISYYRKRRYLNMIGYNDGGFQRQLYELGSLTDFLVASLKEKENIREILNPYKLHYVW